MLEIIRKQQQELVNGLADLYIQKEKIEDQIKVQRVAIEHCRQLLKIGEQKAEVENANSET